MRQVQINPPPRNMSAQQKIAATADSFGIRNITSQQGTTRTVYDSLPLDGRTNFRFFEFVNTRAFPFTNMNAGNKLEVGEAMTIERLTLSVLTVDPVTTFITNVRTLTVAALPQLYRADFTLVQANATVVKPLNIATLKPEFNKFAGHTAYECFSFSTNIVLTENQQFIAQLQTSGYTALANNFLCMTLEGIGTIFSPKGAQ